MIIITAGQHAIALTEGRNGGACSDDSHQTMTMFCSWAANDPTHRSFLSFLLPEWSRSIQKLGKCQNPNVWFRNLGHVKRAARPFHLWGHGTGFLGSGCGDRRLPFPPCLCPFPRRTLFTTCDSWWTMLQLGRPHDPTLTRCLFEYRLPSSIQGFSQFRQIPGVRHSLVIHVCSNCLIGRRSGY